MPRYQRLHDEAIVEFAAKEQEHNGERKSTGGVGGNGRTGNPCCIIGASNMTPWSIIS